MEHEPQHQPLKVAVIFGVLVVAIIAALTFRRAPRAVQETSKANGRITVQKPAVDPAASENSPSHLLGRIDQAPIAAVDTTGDALATVDLSVAPPALPEAFDRAPPAAIADEAFGPRKHRVRDGDTLATLAERFLGDAARANEILAANQALVTNPDLLPIGVELLIPEDEGELTPVAPSH